MFTPLWEYLYDIISDTLHTLTQPCKLSIIDDFKKSIFLWKYLYKKIELTSWTPLGEDISNVLSGIMNTSCRL